MKIEKDKKLQKRWQEERVELLWDELDKLTEVVKAMSDKLKELEKKVGKIINGLHLEDFLACNLE